ncbi:MAG: hypothetical protein IPL62_10945 [Caulobacteraceae bacterium]|nr:hypothetical protein [Caulobacteraceae bacterium]
MDPRAWRAIIMSAASYHRARSSGRWLLLFRRRDHELHRQPLGQANRGHWGSSPTILVFTLTAYVGAPQIVLISARALSPLVLNSAFGMRLSPPSSPAPATYFTGRLTSAETQKRFGGATGGRFTRFIGKNGFLASLIVRFVPAGPFVVVNMAFIPRGELPGLHLRPCDRKLAENCARRVRLRFNSFDALQGESLLQPL